MNIELEKSVVKIICKSYNILWTEPWNISDTVSQLGTGFCVSIPELMPLDHKLRSKVNKHKFILTCAHVITNPKYIYMLKSNSPHTYTAQIEYRLHELDMALISTCVTTDVNTFWDTMTPIPISYKIKKSSTVYALGYPLGGKNVSISKGIASRFEITQYPDSNVNGLVLQIDTPINQGNSGGPATVDNQVIGIVFSSMTGLGVEGISYIVPSIMIKFFIDSIKYGSFGPPDGDRQFCGLVTTYMSYQSTDDINIRNWLNIPKKITGPLITRSGFARAGIDDFDVITHINGISIDNDGNIFIKNLCEITSDGDDDYIPFNFMIGMMHPNENINFTVFRQGEIHEISIKTTPRYMPFPMYINKSSRNYLIIANMAFVPLSNMLFNTIHELGMRSDRLGHIQNIREMVVLVKILRLNNFTPLYFHVLPSMVRSINGIIIQSLSHMNYVIKKILRDKNIKSVILDFYYEPSIIILTTSDILIDTKLALSENNITKRYVGPSVVEK